MSEDFEDGYDGLPDDEIKACPFCGCTITISPILEDADYPLYQIVGHVEGCYLHDTLMREVWEGKEEFLKYWNKRA